MLLRAACDACHRMKRKCDGKQPCTRCERRGRDCFYSCKQKSGPPKGSKRKLVEHEDDLPENRAIKPSRPLTTAWPAAGNETPAPGEAQSSTEVETAQYGPVPGPSPEARAAAAAAVAASRMSAMAPVVPAALAAAGLRPPYMLRPPPVLPGLSGGTVPTAPPLPSLPYGTVYQHQYPPEVYAVYLAELRQRGCSGSSSGSNNNVCGDPTAADATTLAPSADATTTTPAPISGRFGDAKPSPPAEGICTAATNLTADVAAATATATAGYMAGSSTGMELSTTGSELLSEAVNFVEQLEGVERDGGAVGVSGDVTPDRVALAHVAKMAEEGGEGSGSDGPAKEAAVSAAASAALAAAVAAAIAEGSPREGDHDESSNSAVADRGGGGENGWSEIDVDGGHTSPVKGSRFDTVPEIGLATMPAGGSVTTTTAESSDNDVACRNVSSAPAATPTQRERQAAAGLLLYGTNSRTATSTTTTSGGLCGTLTVHEGSGEHTRAKEGEEPCQRKSPKAVAKVRQWRTICARGMESGLKSHVLKALILRCVGRGSQQLLFAATQGRGCSCRFGHWANVVAKVCDFVKTTRLRRSPHIDPGLAFPKDSPVVQRVQCAVDRKVTVVHLYQSGALFMCLYNQACAHV